MASLFTEARKTEMYQFFAVAFNAAPGVTFFTQLQQAVEAGLTTEQIVNEFTTKGEFLNRYPTFLSSQAFATSLVNNVARSSITDAAKTNAVNDIVMALDAGLTRSQVIFNVFTNIAGTTDPMSQYFGVAQQLRNEVNVARYYTEVQLSNSQDPAVLRQVLANVTNATDTSSNAAIQTFLNNNGSGVAGQTITLTAGVDNRTGGAGNDNFDGSLQNNAQTLGSADSLDGGAGIDTLFAVIAGTVTPSRLTSIESVRFTATGISTLDLVNATGTTSVTSQGSTAAATIANIAQTVGVTIQDTAQNHTINYSGVTGAADAATISVTNVTGGVVTANGIETLTLNGVGGNSTIQQLATDTATRVVVTGSSTVAVNTQLNNAVRTLDASASTGGVNVALAAGVAQTLIGGAGNDVLDGTDGADSIVGGAGDDAIVVGNDAAVQALVAANGGDGRDAFRTFGSLTDAAFNTPARITSVEAVQIADGTAINVTLGANATTAGVTTVNFNTTAGSNGGNGANTVDVTALGANATVLTGAGVDTVNINIDANSDSVNTAAAAGADAVIDTINITNTQATQVRVTFTSAEVGNGAVNDGATGTNQDGGLAVRLQRENAAGDLVGDVSRSDDEGVSFRSANTATFDVRDLVSGAARGTFGAVDLGTQGVDTITATAANGSGGYVNAGAGNDLLGGTASADFLVGGAGNDNIQLGTVALNAAVNAGSTTGGNDSVIAGGGDDVVTVGAGATGNMSIDGGDGNDMITSGTGRDTIAGGGGNDTIVGGGGNDVITGGDGADRITVTGPGATTLVNVDAGAGDDTVDVGTTLAGSTATTRDTVSGGDGVDTLVIDAAGLNANDLTSVTGFERLTVAYAPAVNLNTALFGSLDTISVNNPNAAAAGTLTLANTAASFATLNINANLVGGDRVVAVQRLVNTAANALTVNLNMATTGSPAASLDLANEETVTINSGAAPATPAVAPGTVTNQIGTLTGTELTSLILAGSQTLNVNNITGTGLATINASAITGATTQLQVIANNSTVALTFTGGSNEGQTLVGTGSGNDVINAGSGILLASGNAGNDSITGGALADDLSGGAGNDTLNGLAGNDVFNGGVGADVIDGGAGTNTYTAIGLDGALDGGLNASAGQVINLGNALSLNDVNTLTRGAFFLSGQATGVASNTANYLFAGAAPNVLNANVVDTLANIQNITGSGGADLIVGSAGANVINAAGGDDTVAGGVMTAADVIDGQGGVNSVVLAGAITADITYDFNVAGGTNQISGGGAGRIASYANFTNVNASMVTGGGLNAVGGTTANRITGTNQADTINGGAGADDLTGGLGADQFGSSSLFSANGQGILFSASTIGANNALDATETLTFGNGVDIVRDFSNAQGDKLDVATAATAPTSLIAVALNATQGANTTYVAYGTFNETTGVFTAAAAFNAATANAAVLVTGSVNPAVLLDSNTGYVVLTGLAQALVGADFI